MSRLFRTTVSSAETPIARIIFSDSGRGLYTDARLLQKLLEENGWQVQLQVTKPWSVARTCWSQRAASLRSLLPSWCQHVVEKMTVCIGRLNKRRVPLQIHLESVAVEYLSAGQRNWLIPNQEWVRPQHLCFFKYLDRILCKTWEAEQIFNSHHEDVRMISFSNSIADSMPEAPNTDDRYRRFLHVAGRNRKKGSKAIVEAWRMHPEWPELQLVLDDVAMVCSSPEKLPKNIRVWSRIDENRLQQLRLECGVVLAPSEVEGFGHILLEGMAYQAIVVTTDAAPMNELITENRGCLIPWDRKEPCHLGTRYHVSSESLASCVSDIINTPQADLKEIAIRARQWVDTNHRHFIASFRDELQRWDSGSRGRQSPSKNSTRYCSQNH